MAEVRKVKIYSQISWPRLSLCDLVFRWTRLSSRLWSISSSPESEASCMSEHCLRYRIRVSLACRTSISPAAISFRSRLRRDSDLLLLRRGLLSKLLLERRDRWAGLACGSESDCCFLDAPVLVPFPVPFPVPAGAEGVGELCLSSRSMYPSIPR